MTYRAAALSAHAAAVQAEKDRAVQQRQALIDAARTAVRPVVTDSAGKLLIDPLKDLSVSHVDEAAALVVLTTADKSSPPVSLAVQGGSVVKLVELVDGAWTDGPVVAGLAEVGAVLAGEA